MEQKIYDWLKEDIEKVDEKVDRLENKLTEKLNLMGADIKTVLEFRWQLISGSLVVSAIVGVVLQILLSIYSRN